MDQQPHRGPASGAPRRAGSALCPSPRFCRVLAAVGGALTGALGLAILAGWLAGRAPFVGPGLPFEPRPPAAALGFLLAGLAVLAAAWDLPRLAGAVAGLPAALALLALIPNASPAGPLLAPAAALGFLACAGALLLRTSRSRYARLGAGLCGAALAVGGLVGFGSLVAGEPTGPSLAGVTAGGFLLLGLAMLALAGQTAAPRPEEPFRLLVEQALVGIHIIQDGRSAYVNPQLAAIFGYSQQEMLDMPSWLDLVADADKELVSQHVRQRLSAEVPAAHYTFRGRRKDGTVILIEVRGARAEYRGRPAVVGTLLDLSDRQRAEAERKRAEEALRASEACYRAMFEDSPQPMWVYDTATLAFLAVNDAAVAHYGYSRAEFLAMTLKDIRPAEDVPALLALSNRTRWRHRKKDGTLIDVEVIGHSLEFAGRPARLVLLEDVTEQRRLEEQLRQAQKMEAVGRLAGGVAHDFNNLLTVILGYSDLLLKSAALGEARESLQQVHKAAQRAAELTRQLLAFGRKTMLAPRVLDVNDLVRDLERLLGRLLGEDVTLTTRLAPELGAVKADPGQLQQVLLNLAVNARDAMPQGGTLTLRTADVELDERYARRHLEVQPGRYVLLEITDTGCGMSPEVQARVFEPFFTTKEVGKGTGLGLAVVHGIIKQAGGHIEVESTAGQGTTFRVYLPRVEEPAAPSPGPPAEAIVRTVLLVEDEEVVRAYARTVLAQHGYAVLEASDGAEALRRAEEHAGPIDLLVTDVVMPGLGGREVHQHLIGGPYPGLPVLYLSGYTEDEVLRRGVREEEEAFLGKPFTPAALLEKVRAVLGPRP
jgi:PAS domain S-box-containing protein